MRRTPSVLLVLLLVVGLAACGDDDDGAVESDASEERGEGEALTKAAFIERGDAICAELAVATAMVTPPDGPEVFGPYLRELLPLAEQAREAFSLLVPPADGEAVHEALLDALDSSIATVESAAEAAESGDTVTAEDLMAQANEEGSAADEQADEYGFQECGSPAEADGEGASVEEADDRADAYARALIGEDAVVTGCLDTAPAEQGGNAGCVFSAAWEGCHDGITGEQGNPMSIEEQFPEAPELHDVYRTAVEECSA